MRTSLEPSTRTPQRLWRFARLSECCGLHSPQHSPTKNTMRIVQNYLATHSHIITKGVYYLTLL